MRQNRVSSSADTPAADSEEVARLAEQQSEINEVVEETQSDLNSFRQNLETKLTFTEIINNFFQELSLAMQEILISLGLAKPSSNSNTSSNNTTENNTSEINISAEISRLSFEKVGSRTNRTKVYNRTQRQGRNVYTGGMPGRLWGDERSRDGGTDAQFELESSNAISQIRDLVGNLGITTFITLSGSGSPDALQNRLRELGYPNVQVKTVRIPTARTPEEASSAWQRSGFITQVRTAYTSYQEGNCFIHCHNGMHRSVAMSLILFMLANPDLTYQQALELNVSPSEQRDHNFLAYAPLAQALEGNADLRSRILNSNS